MRLPTLLPLLISLPLLASAISTAASSIGLTKRECVSNDCECVRGTKQGQYCGIGGLYECNPAGGCCFYGAAEKCKGFAYGEKEPTIGAPKSHVGG